MNQTRQNLEELLELTTSSAERAELDHLWTELEALEVEAPSLTFDPSTRERRPSAQRHRGRAWLRAAALVGIGVLGGALVVFMGLEDRDTPTSPGDRVTAGLPRATSFERLAATHTIGTRAPFEPEAQATLLERLVHDPSPAVRLAAADYLSPEELTPREIERLTLAVVESASPIVQLRILELLASRRESSVLRTLERLAQDAEAEPVVRRLAAETLTTINVRNTL